MSLLSRHTAPDTKKGNNVSDSPSSRGCSTRCSGGGSSNSSEVDVDGFTTTTSWPDVAAILLTGHLREGGGGRISSMDDGAEFCGDASPADEGSRQACSSEHTGMVISPTGGKSDSAEGSRSSGSRTDDDCERIAVAARDLIVSIGEDPCRQGLVKTPKRFAEAMMELTSGYGIRLIDVVGDAVFDVDCHDMVVVKDIPIHSLCEHHLLPFIGKCHIGYIPNGKVLGLSKLARISDMFSKRLQVQERLNREIAEAIEEVIQPKGVGVVVEAVHMCMTMRGVCKPGAVTTTSCVRGLFKSCAATRAEFMALLCGARSSLLL